MNTITNKHGERTVLTKAAALGNAKYAARYRHGEWFAWQHKSGEWYVASRTHADSVDDAALNIQAGSKVYLIGGGGAGSMTFTRFGASIVQMWARQTEIASGR